MVNILPDELLERILARLSRTDIFRAGAVCKRWKSISAYAPFLQLCEEVASTRHPWYFMSNFTTAAGWAYDPVASKWHNFDPPRTNTLNWVVASVNGLVCFMSLCDDGYNLHIFNPITKATRKLPEPPKKWTFTSNTVSVSMSVNKATKVQTTVVARYDAMPYDDNSRQTLSIDIYDSSSKKWRTTAAQTMLPGWRVVGKGVICNGFFYCVAHPTAMEWRGVGECALITYQLSSGVLKEASMGLPCSLKGAGLMNCNNKLVLVGGVHDNSGRIKGIHIWELDTEWREVATMPNIYFNFTVSSSSFSSSGSGDLIYIHACNCTQLVLYDMSQRSWRGAKACPMENCFEGVCFEPRLEAPA